MARKSVREPPDKTARRPLKNPLLEKTYRAIVPLFGSWNA